MSNTSKFGFWTYKRIGEGRFHVVVTSLFMIKDISSEHEEVRDSLAENFEKKGYFVSKYCTE